MKVNTAIVLCGGLGTRLRSVVSDLPKSMADIQGTPFLEHLLRYWIDQGIQRFILCVGYKADAIISYFGNLYEDAEILYSSEKVALGTGGALLKAKNKFNLVDPFILINGDTFFAVNLASLNNFAIKNNADWCFSLFQSKESSRYLPIMINDDGSLILNSQEIKERQLLESKEITNLPEYFEIEGRLHTCNGGVYWIKPKKLDYFLDEKFKNCSLENELIPLAIKSRQHLYGLVFNELFIDIGIPEDYIRAKNIDFYIKKLHKKDQS
jgi:D-glycero-alpha-D-manno-heptose 1-phosphate guanylyltransferase